MLTEAEGLGIEVKFNTEATADMLAQMNPYAVILATGGLPVRPRSISGIDGENVFTAPEVLLEEKEIKNSRVAVIGSGLTGLETTEKLNENGNTVTVIEMADAVAGAAWFQFVDDSLSRIKPYGTKFMLNTKLVSVDKNGVTVENAKTGEQQKIDADYVVLSMGVKPNNCLLEELEAKGIKAVAVGDASRGGTIGNATQSAFHAAMII